MTRNDTLKRRRGAERGARERLPGSLWANGGRWAWRVKLPGRERRENVALRVREGEDALRVDEVPREIAEGVAWGIWREAEDEVARMVDLELPRVRGRESPGCTVREAVEAYLAAARVYYARSKEANVHAWALKPIAERWGAMPLGALACAELLDERDEMLARGLARRSVNHAVGVWRIWGRWCQDNRLCGVETMRELTAVQSLRRGRSTAREPERVRAVPHWRVKVALRHAGEAVRIMARLQECSGMRPGEVVRMRWEEIERGEPCWIYRPARHKEDWRGMPRAVALGPGARRALVAAGADKQRRGPVFPGKRPCEGWTREAYTRAIERAIEEAVEAGELRRSDAWTPHALRHSAGTRVRRACGLEAARAVLGHSMRGGVTDVYTFEAAEREALRVAVPAAARWG